jgi:hypothetical protein
LYFSVQKRILKELKREPTIRGHVAPDIEQDRRKSRPQPVEIELPDEIQQEPKMPIQTNWEVEETGSSHINVPSVNGQPNYVDTSSTVVASTTMSFDTSLHSPSGTRFQMKTLAALKFSSKCLQISLV